MLSSLAFEEWTKQHWHSLLTFAWRLLIERQAAEDCVQDALMKLWQHRHDIEAISIHAWVRKVIRNQAIDRLRREGKLVHDENLLEHYENGEPDTAQKIYGKELGEQFMVAFAHLPPRQRVILTLNFFEHHSTKKIAALMDISPTACESLLARARRNLKKGMKYDG